MGWLRSFVEAETINAAERWMAANLADIIRPMLGLDLPDNVDLSRPHFTLRVARELVRCGLPRDQGMTEAARVVSDFLKDEKIKFGNPAYAWDGRAAVTLAQECEIQYW